MKKRLCVSAVCLWVCILVGGLRVEACTSLLVTKGATKDGSVIITYACDGEFHPHLSYVPAADYESGDSLEITDWGGNVRGRIKQVAHLRMYRFDERASTNHR